MARREGNRRPSDTSKALIKNSPSLVAVCSSPSQTNNKKVCLELEKGLTMYVSASLADKVLRSGLELELQGRGKKVSDKQEPVTSPPGTDGYTKQHVSWKHKFTGVVSAMAAQCAPKTSPRPRPKMGLSSPAGRHTPGGGSKMAVFTTPDELRKSNHAKTGKRR